MACPLASLVLAAAVAQAGTPTPGAAAPAARDAGPSTLSTPEDVARLCRALVPAERVHASGDAIARGEEEARHDKSRSDALARRYRVVVPGKSLRFAPYDAGAGELALEDAAPLTGAAGGARVWTSEAPGLPLEADPAVARRVLDAQARGTLALAVVFELPDDAECGGAAGARTFTVPAEPIAWRYLDGEAPLAGGGDDAGRALGVKDARPVVEIGAPVVGPPEARDAVAARRGDLERCYADALTRSPELDGILVARLGGGGIAADSVNDAGLADCVRRAVGRVGGNGAVPIRFERRADATAKR